MNRFLVWLILSLLFSPAVYSQTIPDNIIVAKARIIDGDTIPQFDLPVVRIKGYKIYRTPSQQRKHERLVRNIKKVYPYARLAGIKLREYDAMMAGLTEKQQKKLYKQAEDDLKQEFGEDLKKLTITQGHLLLKLVDREVGNPTYNIVKELRGTFIAFFWQNIGRLFGYNLKEKYDPQGKDREIENIVQMIEKGLI